MSGQYTSAIAMISSWRLNISEVNVTLFYEKIDYLAGGEVVQETVINIVTYGTTSHDDTET